MIGRHKERGGGGGEKEAYRFTPMIQFYNIHLVLSDREVDDVSVYLYKILHLIEQLQDSVSENILFLSESRHVARLVVLSQGVESFVCSEASEFKFRVYVYPFSDHN